MNLDQANEVHQVDHRRDGMKDGHQHPRNEEYSKQKNRNMILMKNMACRMEDINNSRRFYAIKHELS